MKILNERFLVVPGLKPGAADSESAMLTFQPPLTKIAWKSDVFQGIAWPGIFEVNFKGILENGR